MRARMRNPLAAFRKLDLFWILACPLYLVLGIIRHEGSHVLAAVGEGATITEFNFIPSVRPDAVFVWGYVLVDGDVSWLTGAAPYFCDLLTFLAVFPLCQFVVFKRRWIWLNLVILGILSPFVNSLNNYITGYTRGGDVGYLRQVMGSIAVDAYFSVTIGAYLIGLFVVLCYSKTVAQGLPNQTRQI